LEFTPLYETITLLGRIDEGRGKWQIGKIKTGIKKPPRLILVKTDILFI
jgi:hypothetical protein